MGTKNGTKSPKQDSNTTGQGKTKVTWKGYINFNLDDGSKRIYEEKIQSGWEPFDLLDELVQDGITLKHGYDKYHSAYVATLYDADENSSFAGYALTARGKSSLVAARRVLFIHYVICSGDWSTVVQAELPDDAW